MMLLAYLFNFSLFTAGLLSFIDLRYFYIFLGMLIVKLLSENEKLQESISPPQSQIGSHIININDCGLNIESRVLIMVEN